MGMRIASPRRRDPREAQEQEREGGVGEAIGFFGAFLMEQLGICGDEDGGEGPFAEDAAEEVGELEAHPERGPGGIDAEEIGAEFVAQEAGDAGKDGEPAHEVGVADEAVVGHGSPKGETEPRPKGSGFASGSSKPLPDGRGSDVRWPSLSTPRV